MKYEKPEIVVFEAASAVIQGNGKDGISRELDEELTNPAYEADE